MSLGRPQHEAAPTFATGYLRCVEILSASVTSWWFSNVTLRVGVRCGRKVPAGVPVGVRLVDADDQAPTVRSVLPLIYDPADVGTVRSNRRFRRD